MSKYDFLMQVKDHLEECHELDGTVVEGNVYLKNNDTECYGVSICRGETFISPVFYVDRFYDAYCQKKLTMEDVVRTIVGHFMTVSEACRDHSDISLEYEDCKEKIIYRLISANKNARYLESIPYIPFLDMAIIFLIVYRLDEEGLESIRVTTELMDSWGVGTEELMMLAKKNTPAIFPATLEPMADVMARLLHMEMDEIEEMELDSPLLLLSNKQGIYGATSMIYEEQAEQIGEILGENFYVIPSSVHEVLILPESEVSDPEPLDEMITQINRDHLGSVDVLSDRAYFYMRNEKRFYF